jgi:pyruvate dehydrogenase E2 component (dihydrolipoamide acetyltransferase)
VAGADSPAPARSKPGSVQAAMARRLTEAKQQVPHFYLALDVRVDALLDLRSQLNALAQERNGVRLTLNHFVLSAVGRALVDLPVFNRVWSDGEIVSFDRADVGVAINTDKGLFVPIVRGAGNVPLESLARDASRLVEAARAGNLTVPDMQGGAVTVSNAGMFQVRYMTPIINPGQAMILGVGAINETFRPGADGTPKLVREMGLVLAGDHRILDGVSGLTFLNQVAGYLSQPLKLLVGAQ